MKCYVCDQDNWHSMDENGVKFHPEREMRVCKGCGSAAYKVEPVSDQDVIEYYRKSYRPAPTHQNFITTTRKLNYMMAPHMLGGFLRGKQNLVCGDIGAAIGYLVAHLRRLGHRATGTELTVTYRRVSEHYYGVPLREDLDPTLKYDLLVMYHVLEHLTSPDEKLAKYAAMLAPGGRFFIATPEWFDVLDQQSGDSIQGVEHHYHKDHINVFSRQSIINLFHKAGLIVETEDHITYGQTYMLRKPNPGELVPAIVPENWEGQAEKLRRTRDALKAFRAKDFEKAIELYPRFPEAYISAIMGQYGKDPAKQQDMWTEVLALCPENFRARQVHGIWLYQHRRYEEAINEFEWVMRYRPNEDAMFRIAETYQAMGKLKESIPYFQRVADLNPTMWAECMNFICHAASKLPAWDERAREEIRESLFEKNKQNFQITPNDPVMDGAANGNGEHPAPPSGLGSGAEQPGEQAVPAA